MNTTQPFDQTKDWLEFISWSWRQSNLLGKLTIELISLPLNIGVLAICIAFDAAEWATTKRSA